MTTNIPTLTTPRLTLRPFTLNDVAPLYRILNQPDILQYFPNPGAPSIERAQKIIEKQLTHWQEHNFGWWAVVPNKQTELIGWNGLQYLPETDEVEVGYLLSKQFWGRGYATEGAKASIQFGFENFNFGEIIGLTHPENIASQNVLKKCGMHFIEQKEYFGMQLFRFMLSKPV
jgi:ribosomal-protein-alanine N-acetyltransferase